MNDIINISTEQTMNSLQIAELTGKRHDAVIRDIRKLLNQGVTAHNFVVSEYKDSTGRTLPCYELTKKGCLILASGYSALLREKIIDRWEELESENVVSNQLPKTFSEALYLAAKQAEQIEKQQRQIEAQNSTIIEQVKAIAMMEPKVSYLDEIISNPSTVLVTQIAQDYGYSAKKFNKVLKDMGIQHKVGRQWILYGKHIAEGYIHSDTQTISTPKGDKIVMLTKWTQKGRLFLYNQLKDKGILPLIEQIN